MNIFIDKNSQTPIYRQIFDEVKKGAKTGVYKYGQKLPPERELSKSLSVSRGTVKRAYEELAKTGVIRIIWGSGAFISKRAESGALHKEGERLEKIISSMEDQGFSQKEIEIYLNLNLLKRQKKVAALIDCNEEALYIFKKQLNIQGLFIIPVLLSELSASKNKDAIYSRFHMIITTTSHYDEVSRLISGQDDKIIKAAVSPDRETIVSLLKAPKTTGIFVKSRRFKDIVSNNMAGLGLRFLEKDCLLEKWAAKDSLNKFLKDKTHIIMPPFGAMDLNPENLNGLLNFVSGGGKIITFNYVIEKGSLIHIEDRVSNLIYNLKE